MAELFEVGGFELDVEGFELRRDRARIHLERIPMEVLILLVRRAGTLVHRREIKDALWGRQIHLEQDAAINTAVRKVRLALNDDSVEPRFIETVVGKGYRFVAPVERREATGPSPRMSDRERPYPLYRISRGRREFPLQPGEHLLGRDPAAQIRIDHTSVSRRHARIVVGADNVILEDLRSRNGTFVDGRRIDAPMRLQDGAVIGVGPVVFRFGALATPGSTKPLPRSGSRSRKAPLT